MPNDRLQPSNRPRTTRATPSAINLEHFLQNASRNRHALTQQNPAQLTAEQASRDRRHRDRETRARRPGVPPTDPHTRTHRVPTAHGPSVVRQVRFDLPLDNPSPPTAPTLPRATRVPTPAHSRVLVTTSVESTHRGQRAPVVRVNPAAAADPKPTRVCARDRGTCRGRPYTLTPLKGMMRTIRQPDRRRPVVVELEGGDLQGGEQVVEERSRVVGDMCVMEGKDRIDLRLRRVEKKKDEGEKVKE